MGGKQTLPLWNGWKLMLSRPKANTNRDTVLLQRSCNAAQSLCDVIRLSRDHMSQLQENADQDPLLDAVQRYKLD